MKTDKGIDITNRRNTNPENQETRRYFEMFFIEKKKEKPNVGKIVAISVGVTFAVAAAIYGVYMFCRKYCKLCDCGDELFDDDFEIGCDDCACDFADEGEEDDVVEL